MLQKRFTAKRPTIGYTQTASRISNNSWKGTSNVRQYFLTAALRIVYVSWTLGGMACVFRPRLSPSCFTTTAEESPEVFRASSRLSQADSKADVCLSVLSLYAEVRFIALKRRPVKRTLCCVLSLEHEYTWLIHLHQYLQHQAKH